MYVSHSVVSDSLRPHGLQPARLLCPWDSPGKNTGVGSHSLLQILKVVSGKIEKVFILLNHYKRQKKKYLPYCKRK